MNIFKIFSGPEKKEGEALNKADRDYLVRLIVWCSLFVICLNVLWTTVTLMTVSKLAKAML